tara:strand:+ start:1666 stop:3942 length:2277 start_codon:yes stop_codon:yes gene_type:complete
MLSRGEVNKSLRSFIAVNGLWGAWGQMVGLNTAVFAGFVLSLGANASDIAFYSAIASILAPVQIISSLFSKSIENKKRWVVWNGILETIFRGLIITIPFLFVESLHQRMLLIFLVTGLVAGYTYTPFLSSWVALTVPENIRARFTSRQTIVASIVGTAVGVLTGRFVDMFPDEEKMTAFVIVFTVGSLCGAAGHLWLRRTPYPANTDETEARNPIRHLLQPFRDENFRQLVMFFASWQFALGLTGPLFSVFMLDRLGFSYTAISLLAALGTVSTIGAYKAWSVLIDRFGSKPVLQILIIPGALVAFLWGICQPGSYTMVAIAMILSGLIMGGINLAVTPLRYALLPKKNQDERVAYLASWSTSINLLYAAGPLLGSILVASMVNVHLTIGGLLIRDINIMFFISGVLRFVPLFLLRRVRDSRSISSQQLLSNMFRGNLLSYTFNYIVFNVATAEDRRARAAFRLGRSRNPMAIDHLVQALSDASSKVRRQAARALGETGSEMAVDTLISELESPSSDIRSEAAEALGRLKHTKAVDALVTALDDDDPRVQISAISGLGQIEGDDVQELLFWYFSNNVDPLTFPTLVEALSHRQDYRIIKPTFDRLESFTSPAVRLQLLNNICYTLGAGDRFYKLLSMEENKRYGELENMIKRTVTRLTESKAVPEDTRRGVESLLALFIKAYERDDRESMVEQARMLAALIRDSHPVVEQSAVDTLSVYLIIMTMNHFIESDGHRDLPAVQEIFLAVCMSRIATLVNQ